MVTRRVPLRRKQTASSTSSDKNVVVKSWKAKQHGPHSNMRHLLQALCWSRLIAGPQRKLNGIWFLMRIRGRGTILPEGIRRRPSRQKEDLESRVKLHASISRFFTQVNNLFHKSTLLNSFKVGQVCMWSDLKILPILTLSPPQICALAHQLCWLLVLLEKVFRNVSLTRLNPC